MDFIELYKQAYGLLECRTPVMFDCGDLCSSACCRDNGKGMLLFPYEENYLSALGTDFIISDSNIIIDDYTVKFLSCRGICSRSTRPLSCRIFPLFPYAYENGRITVKYDPRAYGTCPLLLTDIEGIYMRGLFRLMIFKTAVLLSEEPIIKKFLVMMTKELEAMESFLPSFNPF